MPAGLISNLKEHHYPQDPIPRLTACHFANVTWKTKGFSLALKGTSQNPHFIPTDGTIDETTDEATSHLTDKTTSHSTRLSKDDNQVAGYAVLRKKFLAYISNICGAAKWGKQASRRAYAHKFFP
jgi:hypothetical protein